MPVKLFVGNLSGDAEEGEMRSMFEKFGKVTECAILHHYGFVHMDISEFEAKKVISNLSGQLLAGNEMNVELSKSNQKREGSNYGKTTGDRSKSSRDDRGRGKFGGPSRGNMNKGQNRPSPYGQKNGRSDRDPYGDHRDRDYPLVPPDYFGRRGYSDMASMEDRDPRMYWPPPEIYFRWYYEAARDYYVRDPYARPPPEYYRRERESRDFYGEDKDRDFPSPFGRPGERDYPPRPDYPMVGAGRGRDFKPPDKVDYASAAAKNAAAALVQRPPYPSATGAPFNPYTSTDSTAYAGSGYTSFGK